MATFVLLVVGMFVAQAIQCWVVFVQIARMRRELDEVKSEQGQFRGVARLTKIPLERNPPPAPIIAANA